MGKIKNAKARCFFRSFAISFVIIFCLLFLILGFYTANTRINIKYHGYPNTVVSSEKAGVSAPTFTGLGICAVCGVAGTTGLPLITGVA